MMTSSSDIDAVIAQMEKDGLISENGQMKSYGKRPDGQSDLWCKRHMERPPWDTIAGAASDAHREPSLSESGITPPPAAIARTTSAGVTGAGRTAERLENPRWAALKLPCYNGEEPADT